MNVFVDTNVLIDFICNREPFYEAAEKIFSYALAGKDDIIFTDISVVNTIYVGKRYSYTIEDLSNQLRFTLDYCKLSIIDNNVVMKALNSEWKDKEDAIQYYSAIESLADCIITRNKKDFSESILPVYNPSEFLQEFK